MDDLVTIAEAAELLGQHKNTVRNKVKAGKLVSIKVDTDNGPTYMIPRAALNGESVTVTLPPQFQPTKEDADEIAEAFTKAPAIVEQEERAKRLLQEMLAPFIEQVAQKSEELGVLKERVRMLEEENARLKTVSPMPVQAPAVPLARKIRGWLGVEASGV
jgi:excisionase family DNA binding protein